MKTGGRDAPASGDQASGPRQSATGYRRLAVSPLNNGAAISQDSSD